MIFIRQLLPHNLSGILVQFNPVKHTGNAFAERGRHEAKHARIRNVAAEIFL